MPWRSMVCVCLLVTVTTLPMHPAVSWTDRDAILGRRNIGAQSPGQLEIIRTFGCAVPNSPQLLPTPMLPSHVKFSQRQMPSTTRLVPNFIRAALAPPVAANSLMYSIMLNDMIHKGIRAVTVLRLPFWGGGWGPLFGSLWWSSETGEQQIRFGGKAVSSQLCISSIVRGVEH